MSFLKKLFGISSNKADVKALVNNGAKIIDVRTAAEFSGGHINGAINIPLDKISSNINKIKNYNKPIVLCCASGMRSAQATNQLKQNGVEAYNAGGWKNLN